MSALLTTTRLGSLFYWAPGAARLIRLNRDLTIYLTNRYRQEMDDVAAPLRGDGKANYKRPCTLSNLRRFVAL